MKQTIGANNYHLYDEGMILYNEIPNDIRQIDAFHAFVKNLKKYVNEKF